MSSPLLACTFRLSFHCSQDISVDEMPMSPAALNVVSFHAVNHQMAVPFKEGFRQPLKVAPKHFQRSQQLPLTNPNHPLAMLTTIQPVRIEVACLVYRLP